MFVHTSLSNSLTNVFFLKIFTNNLEFHSISLVIRLLRASVDINQKKTFLYNYR